MLLKICQQGVQPFDVFLAERLPGFNDVNQLFPGLSGYRMCSSPFGFAGDFIAEVADEIEDGKLALIRPGTS